MRYSLKEAQQRLRQFAENPDMELPIHRDREFGLRIFRKRFRSMILLLCIFSLILVTIFMSATQIRYAIVIHRIGGRITDTSLLQSIFKDVMDFLKGQNTRISETFDQFRWFYLRDEEGYRGALVIRVRGKNPFGLAAGTNVIALAPQLIDSRSTWYFRTGKRAMQVRNAALFLTILHELVHHSTSSHEEALEKEKILLANPPPLTNCEVTPEDWKKSREVIDEFIRRI